MFLPWLGLLLILLLPVSEARLGDKYTFETTTDLGDTVWVTQQCRLCESGTILAVTTDVIGRITQTRTRGTHARFPGSTYWRRYAEVHDAWYLNDADRDEKGHILASQLGGPATEWNYMPQLSSVNGNRPGSSIIYESDRWFDAEMWAANLIRQTTGAEVDAFINLQYSPGTTGCRPQKMRWQGYSNIEGNGTRLSMCTPWIRNNARFTLTGGPLPSDYCNVINFTPQQFKRFLKRAQTHGGDYGSFVKDCVTEERGTITNTAAIDAALEIPSARWQMYLFSGPNYLLYDNYYEKIVNGPKPISDWPSLKEADFTENIDAAVSIGGDKALFFSGEKYVIVSVRPGTLSDTIESGPNYIRTGLPKIYSFCPFGVDSAMKIPDFNTLIYIFCGKKYALYDFVNNEFVTRPKSISGSWPALDELGSDMVISSVWISSDYAWFFKSDQYAKVSFTPRTTDDEVKQGWRRLPFYLDVFLAKRKGTNVDAIIDDPSSLENSRSPNLMLFRGPKFEMVSAPQVEDELLYVTPPGLFKNVWAGLAMTRFPYIGAALRKNDSDVFFFSGHFVATVRMDFARSTSSLVAKNTISRQFNGFSKAGFDYSIDAAFAVDHRHSYFFKDDKFLLMDVASNKIIFGPENIAESWPALRAMNFTKVDAVTGTTVVEKRKCIPSLLVFSDEHWGTIGYSGPEGLPAVPLTPEKGRVDDDDELRRRRSTTTFPHERMVVLNGPFHINEVKVANEGERPDRDPGVKHSTCGKRLVGYVPAWSERPFTTSQAAFLTHAIYAFLEMTADGHLAIPATAIARKRLQELQRAKEKHGIRLLFAVGGWVNSQYFSSVAASHTLRDVFVSDVVALLRQHSFDGVDIDWEYPVTGGATEGIAADKGNYVQILRALRAALGKDKLITIAGAAGETSLHKGYDLPGILDIVDWVNVMTYDFYGAWDSQWGAYVGPNAGLYHGAPPKRSGRLNAHWALKTYVCRGGKPDKVVMGMPFYGRYWTSAEEVPEQGYDLYRKAKLQGGKYGGDVSYRDLRNLISSDDYEIRFDNRSRTPYLVGKSGRVYTYDDPYSLREKVAYMLSHKLGGSMIWAVDQDTDDLKLLTTLAKALCKRSSIEEEYMCSPIQEKRWWTWDENATNAGMCGRSAPLYRGYYPVCDPDDVGYSCCSGMGYCGSGPEFCGCPNCKNYGQNPMLLIEEPVKPSRSAEWHTDFSVAKPGQPRCGRGAPPVQTASGPVVATCNPDDPAAPCCSPAGYCGASTAFCECEGCIDFRRSNAPWGRPV